MKRLIMMVMAVVAATVANAASINWKLQTGADYSGMNVYGITGSTAELILAACQSTDSTKWTEAFSGFTAVTATGTTLRAGADGLTTGIAAGDNLVFVIVDGDVSAGNNYWIVNDYKIQSANVFEPPATGVKATIVLSSQGTLGSGTFTAVPEPTSGLLMLLGMAGLALRRRRA